MTPEEIIDKLDEDYYKQNTFYFSQVAPEAFAREVATIFGKQCFEAAREEINNLDFTDPTFGPSLKYKTYEDYLKSLEK